MPVKIIIAGGSQGPVVSVETEGLDAATAAKIYRDAKKELKKEDKE